MILSYHIINIFNFKISYLWKLTKSSKAEVKLLKIIRSKYQEWLEVIDLFDSSIE